MLFLHHFLWWWINNIKVYFFLAKNLLFKVTILADKWGFLCLQRYINIFTDDLTNKNMLILKQMYFSTQHYFDPNILTCTELLLQNPVNTQSFINFLHHLHAHYSFLRLKLKFFPFLSFYLIIPSCFIFIFLLMAYILVLYRTGETRRAKKWSFLIQKLF